MTVAPEQSRGVDAEALRWVCDIAEQHAAACDAAAAFPVAALEAMRESGLLGLLVPGRWGGAGGSVEDMVEATVALGRADLSVAMIFAMHTQQVAAVARFGSDRLRDQVLPGVAAGRVYLGSVTTEPSGSGVLDTQSATSIVDGDLVVNRSAPVVTGGGHADAFLITMRAPHVGHGAVDLVWAGRDQLEVQATGEWQPLGMRATASGGLHLTGRIPSWQVVGSAGGFRTVATQVFAPLAHLGWSAAWLGTAAGASSRVLRHLRSGSGRGRFAPDSELALSRLASVRARLDATHALVRHGVEVVRTAEDLAEPAAQLLLNAVKIRASEDCFAAVEELIELVGLRHGYFGDSETGLERAFRDLRSASLNFANDRLRVTNGALALLDPAVRLA